MSHKQSKLRRPPVMHELAVTQHIADLAIQHAEKAGAQRITTIEVVIGDLSSFVDDSVAFYWGIITEGTIAQHADLQFKRVAARMHCDACHCDYTPDPGELLCPRCGSADVRVTGGTEFYLDAIEVE